jgi:hypothetical protein
MSEYIVHGTSHNNLESILSDGYIRTDIDEKHLSMLNTPSNFIFTQLVYRNIPNEKYKNPFYGQYAFILDKKILKDLPFYAGRIACFEYIKSNGSYDKSDNAIIMYGKGKYKRTPCLNKLKNEIEDSMKKDMIFEYSHEILFNKNISLKKYCIALVYKGDYKNIPENVLKKANELKIPIKIYTTTDKFYIGINKFIDIIEVATVN